ncbi:MAG: DUF488 family protein [Candidatus Aminicenantes bacterium]|nr:DUF488 family protein [Candidatus Aminicenantes bacterium]
MKIYTSNFKSMFSIQELGIIPISIAIKPPRWYKGERIMALAPALETLNWETTRYTQRYNQQLKSLNPLEIMNKIELITVGERDVALLCFEKVGDFCHRQLVAQWLKATLGIEVTELKF